jgi:DNA-binding MarR family transcriptional regulator
MKTKTEPDPDLDAFVSEVLTLFPRMMRGFMREERNALSAGKITLPQFWILQVLAERGICQMRDLTKELRIPPSTATVLMDRLVSLRLAGRELDPDDRRAIRVRMTARGRAMMARVLGQKRDILRRASEGLPAADRAAYLRVLDHIGRATGVPGSETSR